MLYKTKVTWPEVIFLDICIYVEIKIGSLLTILMLVHSSYYQQLADWDLA